MNKAIFIIGCPRSGTTLTHSIMACHEELAWVSNMLNSSPFQLNLSRRNRIFDLPYFGNKLYLAKVNKHKSKFIPDRLRRYLPVPQEPWKFWNAHLSNFQWIRNGQIPPRRRTKEDISEMEIAQIRNTINSICNYQRKRIFLSKYTDFPRIKYLTQAFPEAIFLHIIRDGRAVSASYIEKIEKGTAGTWDEREWWIKGWPMSWQEEWNKKYNNALSLVAFQWKFFVSEIRKDSETVNKEQYLEVNYRDIISNPQSTFSNIFEFCGLNKSRKVKWYLNRISFRDNNEKWKEKFTSKEKEILAEIIHEPEFLKILDP